MFMWERGRLYMEHLGGYAGDSAAIGHPTMAITGLHLIRSSKPYLIAFSTSTYFSIFANHAFSSGVETSFHQVSK